MAQANYVQEGKSIDYTPDSAVAAGDVIVVGNLIGIAKLDIPKDKLGALATQGVFDIAKITGEIASGVKLYWDADADPVGGVEGSGAITTIAAGNVFAGISIKPAAETAGYVRIMLGQDFTAKLANIADSTASDTAGIVADFNGLLAALQAGGFMAAGA